MVTEDRPRRSRPRQVSSGRLRVHDPFELIRWLALSQSDPRKALAELVQNSLDAGARRVRVSRERLRGVPCLRIWDDGVGVIPELPRVEALEYIATHIGHSRKQQLTPQQRLQLMTQGQYGIGLLGFWSLGEELELRTCVPGQGAHRLVLQRDRPDYRIEPLRGRLPLEERWTEVVVSALHREAQPALVARRAADFLAAELRGQLLAREVKLEIFDRMSRGRGLKHAQVRPRRYLGERLDVPEIVPVEGFPPLRAELYVAASGASEERERVALYVAGTLVAESFEDLSALGLDHTPWTDPRLSGYIDFPALAVAPGSRRGVVPDGAAGAFARALLDLEPAVVGRLAELAQRQAEALDRDLIRSLRRAFRDFYRQRPRYALLPVDTERAALGGPAEARAGAPTGAGEAASAPAAGVEGNDEDAEPSDPALFPAGPLAEVRIVPRRLRLECGAEATARARALDASGRRIGEPIALRWWFEGAVARLEGVEGAADRVLLVASDRPGRGLVGVEARSGEAAARATVSVEVVEVLDGRSTEGIPDPELVEEPALPWRSRLLDGRWQINAGHSDYRTAAERPGLKLRYLSLLFAKEVVLASTHDPRLAGVLEQLVEVAAFADRNLQGGRRG